MASSGVMKFCVEDDLLRVSPSPTWEEEGVPDAEWLRRSETGGYSGGKNLWCFFCFFNRESAALI